MLRREENYAFCFVRRTTAIEWRGQPFGRNTMPSETVAV